ncbi:MAG TPA: methyltransferase [Allosphingosinicella sp.]|jgi:predicted methyltransferase
MKVKTALKAGFAACLAVAIVAGPAAGAPDSRSTPIARAIADSGRPAADRARDANRKPAAMLAFAGLRAGDAVADYAAGNGYFTRLFAGVVGPRGHVYASVPASLLRFSNIVQGLADLQHYAVDHPNVSVLFGSALDVARYPGKLDLFWISQNYHDLHDSFMGPVDMRAFNRAVFDALKPGGTYVVLDHVAAPGSPDNVTDTLHRILPSTVRREVEAAGFEFVGSSNVLANPDDPHKAGVFDPSIRGRTDQFILKFRRPRR